MVRPKRLAGLAADGPRWPVGLLGSLLPLSYFLKQKITKKKRRREEVLGRKLDLPKPHFLFKSFEFKSNEFEFKLSVMPTSIFPGSISFL